MTTENANPRHLARSLQRLYTTTRRQAQKGLNAENSRRLQLEGEIFLLTFPFIELQGGPFRSGPRQPGRQERLMVAVSKKESPTELMALCVK
jgi:hypothetical protein